MDSAIGSIASILLRILLMISGDMLAVKGLGAVAFGMAICMTPATGHTQTPDLFLTAAEHAGLAAEAKELAEIRLHLQHVLNCLEGSKGRDYKKALGNPCTGQGALQSLPKGSADRVRAQKAIALARVAVTLHHVPPAHYVAQAVNAILRESNR